MPHSIEGEGRRLNWLRKYTMRLPELGPNAGRLLSAVIVATGIAIVIIVGTKILRLHLHVALFVICCCLGPVMGRKLGWIISRNVLYSAPTSLAVLVCILWGMGTAFGFRLVVIGLRPNIILAIIGFMAGGYISIPNYGLIAESTIPEGVSVRHEIVSSLPSLVYIVASILFYFTIRGLNG